MNSLEQIWDDYQLILGALIREKSKLLDETLNTDQISNPILTGLTEQELKDHFNALFIEIDHQISLTILAHTEAILRVDYSERVKRRLRDALSKKFRTVSQSRDDPRKISFERDILESWEEVRPELKTIISEIKGAMKYRHWLAHGRYWAPKLGKNYEPNGLFSLIQSFCRRATLLKKL